MRNRWGSDASLPLAGPKQAPVMGSHGTPGPQLHVGTSTAENTQVTVKVLLDSNTGFYSREPIKSQLINQNINYIKFS